MQTKPELRPSLSQILQHSFFTRPEISTPAQLPEMALREPPVFTSIESESVSFKKYILASHEVREVILKNLTKNIFVSSGDDSDSKNDYVIHIVFILNT